MDKIDYKDPPLTVNEVADIEERWERIEASGTKAKPSVPNQTASHADCGRLITQLNYCAAIIIDLSIRIEFLRSTIEESE